MKTKTQIDLFQQITDTLVEAIEAGTTDGYRMPWHATGRPIMSPINVVSKRPYRGANVVVLWAIAEKFGYPSGLWGTYRQWQELGAQVRKGEKSAMVVFWKFLDRRVEDQPGNDDHADDDGGNEESTSSKRIPYARPYFVFNAAQVDGFEPKKHFEELPESSRIAAAEKLFSSIPATVRHGGDSAFYMPAGDYVQMPPFSHFKSPHGYYATLAHELTHWTGSKTRLNRADLKARFGSDAYAAEELVAELGAAFVMGHLGLMNDPRPDHAGYLASWLKVLKGDKKAIFTAASKAQQAFDYLLQQQQQR